MTSCAPVAAFNEGETVATVVNGVRPCAADVVVVDDGSGDRDDPTRSGGRGDRPAARSKTTFRGWSKRRSGHVMIYRSASGRSPAAASSLAFIGTEIADSQPGFQPIRPQT